MQGFVIMAAQRVRPHTTCTTTAHAQEACMRGARGFPVQGRAKEPHGLSSSRVHRTLLRYTARDPIHPYSVQSVGAAEAVSLATGHNPGRVATPTHDTNKLALILPTSER